LVEKKKEKGKGKKRRNGKIWKFISIGREVKLRPMPAAFEDAAKGIREKKGGALEWFQMHLASVLPMHPVLLHHHPHHASFG
jgi:hypothetical protein